MVLLFAAAVRGATTNVLVPPGSIWKYLDDGSNQGTAWRAPDFDESFWPEGFAQLGFGDNDEETVLNGGHVTYYFRAWFDVVGASAYGGLTLGLLRDDGAVVYINGTEVWRNNMPAGSVGYLTAASTNVTGPGEDVYYAAAISPSVLVEGPNLVAVEVHQITAGNADVSFDLQLSGVVVPANITRGPYLQRRGTTNMTVRWRTSAPTDSEVRYGATPNALLFSAVNPAETTEHEVVLTGLVPDTQYYYSVGLSGLPLAGDSTHFFRTAPVAGKPTRVWVIGDAGTGGFSQRSVYDAYRSLAGQQSPDVWLMLGDNAYGSGTDAQYQGALFNMYPEFLKQTVAWATIGNHEFYATFNPNDFPFFQIFSQPVAGECGGVPSGTEKYYSFNHGDIHFVCLDAMTSDRTPAGPMAVWLQQDLAANTNLWLIAFWHHPPYTKGTHDSDFEGELVQMRQSMVPILESYGVDLVLCGHSHVYERSFLIDGHYGTTGTFTEAMKKDGQSGHADGTGPYVKPVAGPVANQGAVYVVAGSSGQTGGGSLNHPAMFYSSPLLGSLVLDIDGPVMQARFLRETGAVDDYFTLIKGGPGGQFGEVSYEFDGITLTLRWQSRADRSYVVECTTTLDPANWIPASVGVPGTGAAMSWSMPLTGAGPRGFFRVKEYQD
jgi:hypothetical protein